MTFDGKWFATWEGKLTPISQTYRIWIRYFPERFWDEVTLDHRYVTVKALDPPIAPDVRGTGEPTPHVYRYRQPLHSPALCAWDPVDEPFDPSIYIADHVIPAVVRWLVFYEDWLDTGVWRGGGKHPEPDAPLMEHRPVFGTSTGLPPEMANFTSAQDRRVAELIGSSTSTMAIGRAAYGQFPSATDLAAYRFSKWTGLELGRKDQSWMGDGFSVIPPSVEQERDFACNGATECILSSGS